MDFPGNDRFLKRKIPSLFKSKTLQEHSLNLFLSEPFPGSPEPPFRERHRWACQFPRKWAVFFCRGYLQILWKLALGWEDVEKVGGGGKLRDIKAKRMWEGEMRGEIHWQHKKEVELSFFFFTKEKNIFQFRNFSHFSPKIFPGNGGSAIFHLGDPDRSKLRLLFVYRFSNVGSGQSCVIPVI